MSKISIADLMRLNMLGNTTMQASNQTRKILESWHTAKTAHADINYSFNLPGKYKILLNKHYFSHLALNMYIISSPLLPVSDSC